MGTWGTQYPVKDLGDLYGLIAKEYLSKALIINATVHKIGCTEIQHMLPQEKNQIKDVKGTVQRDGSGRN